MCKYSPLSHYHTRRQLPCIHHELWLLGLTFWWKAFLSGLDNGLSESSQNSKPMKHPLKVFHRTQATDHPLQFELMHYLSRYAHIVSDVCWKLKLHHKHLNKFTVTTLTCQMQGTATILQVWDTTYDTVDRERQRTGSFLTLSTTFRSTLSLVSSSRTIS